jgi:hypothetical protein
VTSSAGRDAADVMAFAARHDETETGGGMVADVERDR